MLELRNVTKIFNLTGNKEDANVVLDNLNLKIDDGDFVSIIGSNGSGKSTTMNVVTGSLKPDKGKIILDNVDITNKKENERAKYFGRVFQDPMMGTCADMSILENLEIAYRRGKRHGLSWGFKKANKKIFVEELKRFDLGLENRLTQKVGSLSGGQRQALTLLMASLNKPKILLLDEHTAALDPKTAKKVLDLTEKIVEENKLTTLMVTHNMRDAVRYGNRLIMFDHGHVILDVKGEEKKNYSIDALIHMFDEVNSKYLK